jgi:hypothetical protein
MHTVVDLQTCLAPQYVEHFWLGNCVNRCGIAAFINVELTADKLQALHAALSFPVEQVNMIEVRLAYLRLCK